MATEIKSPLIQKAAIRTMKKDLQKLREADILAESEKIIGTSTASSVKTLSVAVSPPQVVPIKKESILPDKKIGDEGSNPINRTVVERYASEEEKQRLFALKSKKEESDRQAQAISGEKKPEILSQKTKFEAIKNLWRKKLTPLQEKSAAGKQKWGEEKKEWKAEKEMIEAEREIKKTAVDYEKATEEEAKIKNEAQKAEEALKGIYSAVSARKEEKEKSRLQSNTGSRIPTLSVSGQPSIPQKTEEVAIIKPTFEEKMAKAATEEDKIRIKFMEDVEKWASSHVNE